MTCSTRSVRALFLTYIPTTESIILKHRKSGWTRKSRSTISISLLQLLEVRRPRYQCHGRRFCPGSRTGRWFVSFFCFTSQLHEFFLAAALTVACSQEGFSLPELTLPGQNPNRTLSTVSGAHISTRSFSQITLSATPGTPPAPTISQMTVTSVPPVPTLPPVGPPSSATIQSPDMMVFLVFGTLAGWMLV